MPYTHTHFASVLFRQNVPGIRDDDDIQNPEGSCGSFGQPLGKWVAGNRI